MALFLLFPVLFFSCFRSCYSPVRRARLFLSYFKAFSCIRRTSAPCKSPVFFSTSSASKSSHGRRCASSGLRHGEKRSAGRDIGPIGFVLRDAENGCIDFGIAS